MTALGAYFGRIFSAGVELALRGGLNFTDGLQAVANRAMDRIDVGLAANLVNSVGHVELTATAATVLDASTYTRIGGTFALGASCGSDWTLGAGGATLAWGGSSSVTVAAFATCSISSVGTKQMRLKFAVDGTPVNEYAVIVPAGSTATAFPHVSLLSVDPDEEVELMVANFSDGTDPTISSLSMVLVALR